LISGRQIQSSAGYFRVSWDSMHSDLSATDASIPADTPPMIQKRESWSTPKVRELYPRLGFSFAGLAHSFDEQTHRPDTKWVNTLNHRIVQIHYWFPTALLAALPLCWVFLRIRRGRGKGAGFCRVCGYDLRGTPDRCPECGRAARNVSRD
jgi:hypothetical protein